MSIFDASSSPAVLTFGDIVLDRKRHLVFVQTRPLSLGPTEFRLLEFLMLHPRQIFSREQILNRLWSTEADISDRTVDAHIGRLRRGLRALGGNDLIRTVRGAGYSLDDITC